MGVPLMNALYWRNLSTNDCEIWHKKTDTLGCSPLRDSMALTSAILELLTSESPIFRFCTFWRHKHLDGFRRWETNLHKVLGHDSPIICAEHVYFGVPKNALFWNHGRPIGSGINKNGSKCCSFSTLVKFRVQICQMSKEKMKIAVKTNGTTQEWRRSVQRVRRYGPLH